ncbi:beta-N-acetylhexosaminidase [Streptosporangium sp. KLBMP 9127]|nr:beta-N-acetylhexosaminidase [Streptosporangium sp. KLBMP 9127]
MADEVNLVPLPSEVEILPAGFALDEPMVISAPPEAAAVAGHLVRAVLDATGRRPELGAAGAVRLSLDAPQAGAEGYDLVVDPDGVRLSAATPAGLFWGVQTLRQLLPTGPGRQIDGIRVSDRPRFAWRGAMLDVARHFFAVADVKRYIDLISAYKLNVLHLHLSDDQGWRLAIDGWPDLTAVGGSTEIGGGPGGFYDADDYREIVAYARDRFVEIVPEIDLPGHTNAALASYAELNCDGRRREPYTGMKVGFSALCVGSPATDRFVSDVVAAVARLTPGPYLHIGGDEVQTLSAQEYAAFVERAQELVRATGKRMVGWQEIGKAKLAADSITQFWQTNDPPDEVQQAVRQGGKLVMSPASRVYLDMKYDADTRIGLDWAGFVEVRDAYEWDPATVVQGVGEQDVLGVETPLWTETVETIADVEYLAFPRLPAVAEVAWSPQRARSFDRFAARLASHAALWKRWDVTYHRSPQIPWAD